MINIIHTRDELYQAVKVISHVYKCSITSGARSKKRNERVGGSETSQHQIGCAWDLVPDNYKHAKAIVTIFKSMGCWAQDEDDHIHVQLNRRFLNARDYVF